MNDNAFFTVKHKFCESDMWLAEPFTRGQAWVDLIKLANFKPMTIRKRGIKVEVPRGGVGWSEVELAKRWKWSRGKLRRFLKELTTAQQIEQQKNNVTSWIYLVNYEEHQLGGTAERSANGTADEQQTVPDKEVKEVKEGKEKKKTNGAPRLSCPDDVSETVWTDFLAHRKAKKSAVTQTAMNRIRSQAEKAGWTFEDALAEICSRGWQGFKAEWVTKKESSYDNIPLITEDDL